jgi:hypothetical protein
LSLTNSIHPLIYKDEFPIISKLDYSINSIIMAHIRSYDIIVNLCEDLNLSNPYQTLRAIKIISGFED